MKSRDKSKVFLNTLIITASAVIEKAIFFALNIIIARYLDLNQYGEYTTSLAFASFFSMFTDMGINEGLIREINYVKESAQTLFNIGLLKVFLSIAVFLLFTGITLNTGYSDEVVYITLIFGLVRFGDEYLRLYYTYYEGTGGYITSALYRLFFALSFLVAVVIVIIIDGGNREIAWFRFIVVAFFLVILTYRISRKRLVKVDMPYIKSFSRKTFPFVSVFIYNNIIKQGNLIILPLIHGTFYTGIFQNAYIFLITLLFIPESFGKVFIPYLYRQQSENDVEKFQFAFNMITKSFVVISFFIAVILYLYSDFIITGVFGEKYRDSIDNLRILSLGIPFFFNAAYIILTALDLQKIYSGILRYIAVGSILLNIILGYYFKDKGASAATVTTFLFIFFFSNCLIAFNSKITVGTSVASYFKGAAIFVICLMVNGFISWMHPFISVTAITLVYFLLSIVLLITKDDIRIFREIIGRG